MLMMVDPHVHFHVLPRYAQTRVFDGVQFPDTGWPGPPDLKSATDLGRAVPQSACCKPCNSCWPEELRHRAPHRRPPCPQTDRSAAGRRNGDRSLDAAGRAHGAAARHHPWQEEFLRRGLRAARLSGSPLSRAPPFPPHCFSACYSASARCRPIPRPTPSWRRASASTAWSVRSSCWHFCSALLSLFIFGWAQPYTRYAYRSVVFDVQNVEFFYLAEEGVFMQAGGRAPLSSTGSIAARNAFEQSSSMTTAGQQGSETVTATRGALIEVPGEPRPVLHLEHGHRLEFKIAPGAGGRSDRSSAKLPNSPWPIRRSARYRRISSARAARTSAN